MGRGSWRDGRIRYSRAKTAVAAALPVLPELDEELQRMPEDQYLFLTHTEGRGYTVESLGNWLKDQCVAARVTTGSAHGLRKAGAPRLAEAGATEWEIASYLAHSSTKTAAIYAASQPREACRQWDGKAQEEIMNRV